MYWDIWVNLGEWLQSTGLLGHGLVLVLGILIFVAGIITGRNNE